MSDETRIERDLERQSISELFRISDAIKDKAPSLPKAAEVLDYLKQQLDMLNLLWEVTPKENKLIIQLNYFRCRVWNNSTCSWSTITSDRFEDHHGIVYFITIDRDANIQFVKQKKKQPLDKDLKYAISGIDDSNH